MLPYHPDIFGPYTIGYNAADGCNYSVWAAAADAAAQTDGIDLSIYHTKSMRCLRQRLADGRGWHGGLWNVLPGMREFNFGCLHG